jgi:O-antigen/teichoic acid export membrane protein
MQILKRLVNKHTLSLASNAVMPIISMVTVSLLARNLTERDLGYWILFLITFTIANFFRSGFLQTSLVKFYAGANKERAAIVVGSTWFMGLLLTSLLAIVSLITYLFGSNPSLEITVKWFAIIFFSTLPSSIALWVLQAEERFDKIFLLQLIHPASFFLSIVGLIIIHQTHFRFVIYAYCFSAMLTSIISMAAGWAKAASIRKKSNECVKELVNFGKFSVFTSISSYLLRGSDTFIIKYMFVDPSFVAIYYLPQRLMEVIEIPLRSFIATALPAMSAALQRDEKRQMTYIMKKYAGILTILLIPMSIVTFICADFIIEIIGGHKFVPTEAARVFRIFLCFAVLLPVDRFFGITLDILNKPHLNLIKVVIMLVVNVAGDFAGIYFTHSLYGVALASIVSFIAGVVYGYWVLKKNLQFTMRDILQLGYSETKLLIISLISRIKVNND